TRRSLSQTGSGPTPRDFILAAASWRVASGPMHSTPRVITSLTRMGSLLSRGPDRATVAVLMLVRSVISYLQPSDVRLLGAVGASRGADRALERVERPAAPKRMKLYRDVAITTTGVWQDLCHRPKVTPGRRAALGQGSESTFAKCPARAASSGQSPTRTSILVLAR